MSRNRPILLAATSLSLASWLVSCAPASDKDGRTEQTSRDIQLVQPVGPDSVGVSELEAGRPPRTTPEPRVLARKSTVDVVVPEPEPAPTVTTTEAPVLEPVQAPALAPAPSPAVEEEVDEVKAGPIQPVYAIDMNPAPVRGDGRGPIIIRGGRGGFHDPCDIHRPGFGRFPIADRGIR